MLTAVAAIVLGVWDSAQNRKHNRLSVAPYLVCSYTMSATRDATTFTILLSNEGIGPAVIRSVEIVMPSQLGGGTFREWGPAVEALRARGLEVPSYWNYSNGEALGVQKHQVLLRAVLSDAQGSQDLLEQLSKIRVVVTYASVYGDVEKARLN